MNKIANKNIP